MRIDWKIGVEIELLAPTGSSREELASAIARQHGSRVRRVLHQDSEPSKVPGQPIFYNLTQGFEALDAQDRLLVRCVDDLTLQHDLQRQAVPKAGWWRLVCDDERLLRLLALHTDAELDLPAALARLAPLFNGQLLAAPGGLFRLVDAIGAPLAIAAPLPGERERACELITPPLSDDHFDRLELLLGSARRLGFGIPLEGATHLHFDASALCSAPVIRNLVNWLQTWGSCLRLLCGTPPHFRRVGGWPQTLADCVNADDFCTLPWAEAQARLRALSLSKYCDFNLKNIAYARADRHTFEVRIFPAYTEAQPVIAAASLFEGVLRWCMSSHELGPSAAVPWSAQVMQQMLAALPLSVATLGYWQARIGAVESPS